MNKAPCLILETLPQKAFLIRQENLRIAVQGYEIKWQDRPSSNLVFLVDSSGSMQPENRLPLVKEALSHLISRLDERDRVAVVTYSGSSRLVLPSTTANNQDTIRFAVDSFHQETPKTEATLGTPIVKPAPCAQASRGSSPKVRIREATSL